MANTHAKMLNIIHHQQNVNQNHDEMSLTAVRMAILLFKKGRKNIKMTGIGGGVRNWNPCALLVGMQNGVASMENST